MFASRQKEPPPSAHSFSRFWDIAFGFPMTVLAGWLTVLEIYTPARCSREPCTSDSRPRAGSARREKSPGSRLRSQSGRHSPIVRTERSVLEGTGLAPPCGANREVIPVSVHVALEQEVEEPTQVRLGVLGQTDLEPHLPFFATRAGAAASSMRCRLSITASASTQSPVRSSTPRRESPDKRLMPSVAQQLQRPARQEPVQATPGAHDSQAHFPLCQSTLQQQ
jgi:hypothetical protein